MNVGYQDFAIFKKIFGFQLERLSYLGHNELTMKICSETPPWTQSYHEQGPSSPYIMINAGMTERKAGGRKNETPTNPLDRQHIRSTLTLLSLCWLRMYHNGLPFDFTIALECTSKDYKCYSSNGIRLALLTSLSSLGEKFSNKLGFVV